MPLSIIALLSRQTLTAMNAAKSAPPAGQSSSKSGTVTTSSAQNGARKGPRPARKQVSPAVLERVRAASRENQTGTSYNIWYNKWAGGDREDSYNNKTKSITRCDIARDAGYTRADANGGAYCCLYFARGCCPLG